jgi:hypothetical protein
MFANVRSMSSKNTRKAKSLRAARGNARKQNVRSTRSPSARMVLYASPRTVMPQEFVTNMKYITGDVVTSVGGLLASIRFRSDAYDVDPALASTAMAGFAELASIYARFRCLRMSYKFSVANFEAFSVSIIHGFSNASVASGSLSIAFAGNPLFSTAMVGPATGMNTRTCRKSASIMAIAGTKQALFDDLYTGSTTSSTLATAGTCWCYLGIISPTVLTALGVYVTVEVTLQLQFYRSNLLAG